MKSTSSAYAVLMIGAIFLTSVACQRQEGPAERAGKEVDKAAEQAGQQIEKAGQKLRDAAKGDGK